MEANSIGYINTMLEYYLGINPDTLTDNEWVEKYAQLKDIRKRESQN